MIADCGLRTPTPARKPRRAGDPGIADCKRSPRVTLRGGAGTQAFEIRNPKSAIRNQRGFTLLEVLIATAIIGIAVSALMGGFSGSLRNLARAGDYERAVLLARSQINRLLIEQTLEPGPLSGRWDDNYRWEAEVSQWDPARAREHGSGEPLPKVAVIRFTVYWKGVGGEKSLTLETAKHEPRMQNP